MILLRLSRKRDEAPLWLQPWVRALLAHALRRPCSLYDIVWLERIAILAPKKPQEDSNRNSDKSPVTC
ncbi:hypothetical protein TNCV_4379111 [Trichonephila clavipes]|nr:hypothetical protein TNCV_4379111 [Trichonephila clavipes]